MLDCERHPKGAGIGLNRTTSLFAGRYSFSLGVSDPVPSPCRSATEASSFSSSSENDRAIVSCSRRAELHHHEGHGKHDGGQGNRARGDRGTDRYRGLRAQRGRHVRKVTMLQANEHQADDERHQDVQQRDAIGRQVEERLPWGH